MNPCPVCGFDNELATGFCHDCLASLDPVRTHEYRDEHFETLRSACEQAYGDRLAPARLRAAIAVQRARVLESIAELDEAAAEPDEPDDPEAAECLAQVSTHLQDFLQGLDTLEQFCVEPDPASLERGLTQVERATRALNLALMT